MTAITDTALKIVQATGPTGAIVFAALVGLVLGALIIVYTAGLFTAHATDKQQTEFQAKLIAFVEQLARSEAALRREVDELQIDNQALRETIRELTASIDLLRGQNRRFLDVLRVRGTDAAEAGLSA